MEELELQNVRLQKELAAATNANHAATLKLHEALRQIHDNKEALRYVAFGGPLHTP